jgi:hypothetical protein
MVTNKVRKTCLDRLSKSGQLLDRGGLTKLFELYKNMGVGQIVYFQNREEISHVLIMWTGYLDNILTHQDSKISFWKHRRFGVVIDISIPGQRVQDFFKMVNSWIFGALIMNVQNSINNFRIVIASLPDREHCVCEIYYKQIEWAEISKGDGKIMIQFYPNPSQDYWEFPFDMALHILQKAKERFLNE